MIGFAAKGTSEPTARSRQRKPVFLICKVVPADATLIRYKKGMINLVTDSKGKIANLLASDSAMKLNSSRMHIYKNSIQYRMYNNIRSVPFDSTDTR